MRLEVIWTAFKLRASSEEVRERVFHFTYNGVRRECKFGAASSQLLLLAKYCFPCSMPNSSEHRNILSLNLLANESGLSNLGSAISFFIDCAGLDDEGIYDLVVHLNAYMSYFDHQTPRILVHDKITVEQQRRDRYIDEEFPPEIAARKIDANILAYWNEMVGTPNEVLKYLLCYRIIEYAGFNYVEPATRARMRKVISNPNALNNMDGLVSSIASIAATAVGKDEIQRIQTFVQNSVSLDRLWSEISKCRDFFCEASRFDGGFEVKALISKQDTFDTWSTNGVRNTLDRLRNIRNALAHGQDAQTRATILPTRMSRNVIRPWLNLIEIVAGEAMLYRDVV